MTVAVLVPVHGRHAHLRGVLARLPDQVRTPDLVVVAAMGDPEVAGVVAEVAAGPAWRAAMPTVVPEVLDVPVDARGLPLARARNTLAAHAIGRGADVLVLLDVDCLPSPALVASYADAVAGLRAERGDRPVVAAGPVHYLPPAPPGGYADADLAASSPHPARPVPSGTRAQADDLMLLWSLSLAVDASSWRAVGGFDEAYVGYGGEDTDWAMRLDRAGGELWWVRDAVAFHQHHPVESPPVRHVDAIVRNANVFHDRWGFFPMGGWLEAFAEAGLAELDEPVTPSGGPPRWRRRGSGGTGRRTP
ncbi:glycosyltransferase family 2 protein [Lapillicoccus jejuensis]|uniref:GT2 family glycosyltransferase n=1 Tax=Lapillicoccus jejuensis TaxID=402171 RepID=A0A542DXZ1_9MICO|nr:galactosyltransferase-related protein [Lapillicoccus jejuensis]TQJ07804.1 GT2 family glycosyltransferase [Lapillicoccus jejuensis]